MKVRKVSGSEKPNTKTSAQPKRKTFLLGRDFSNSTVHKNKSRPKLQKSLQLKAMASIMVPTKFTIKSTVLALQQKTDKKAKNKSWKLCAVRKIPGSEKPNTKTSAQIKTRDIFAGRFPLGRDFSKSTVHKNKSRPKLQKSLQLKAMASIIVQNQIHNKINSPGIATKKQTKKQKTKVGNYVQSEKSLEAKSRTQKHLHKRSAEAVFGGGFSLGRDFSKSTDSQKSNCFFSHTNVFAMPNRILNCKFFQSLL